MVQLSRSTKFTCICFGIYVSYAVFIFLLLPLLMPDPVTLQRSMLAYKTRHLGNLTKYTLETGGEPIRSLLVTFRGSGALKLLDNLSFQPGCYQHYAPLIAYLNRMNAAQRHEQALEEILALYKCDYNKSAPMLSWGMKSSTFQRFYGVQWKNSLIYPKNVCWDAQVMADICKIHPFLNMAVYNLRLEYLSALLERKDLNVKIMLLIRDPRGIMYSRAKSAWCASSPDCQAVNLCSDMASDYKTAMSLMRLFPHRFGVARYEDLVSKPEQTMQTIFNFYGLPMKRSKEVIRGVHPRSAHRDVDGWEFPWRHSNEPAFDWMYKMKTEDIKAIQSVCKDAMSMWRYRLVQDFEGFLPETFQPLLDNP
ncbi:uncharacterized protein LOC117584519 [Drosophila guanche]|uniref:Blast:Carbohydrate sulfotransferase 3 n=1 Tax=Drosophila guanche TaxID=7266 RepID=A0A3B0JIV1_DROGU|nr:uncharacterized protein LOC117584519 [Drosophila guanche]SPP82354.1 blast:Carbohydrate sulfotransferase 3 [Drosophila guanche]